LAAESSLVAGIAGRYATALFDLARDAGALDTVSADLDRLDAAIAGSPEFAALLRSPLFTRAEQAKGIAATLEKLGVGDLVRRFVGLVAHNRRAFALAGMIGAYRARLDVHRNRSTADVVAATPLSDRQLADLKAALAQSTKGEVNVRVKVDPDLLGGLTVKLGSRMIDASLRTRLNSLKHAMKGVG
jgi:F-type H+-transporting ATPase subunit delta